MPRDEEDVDKYLATMVDKCVAIIAEKYLATIFRGTNRQILHSEAPFELLGKYWVGKWL